MIFLLLICLLFLGGHTSFPLPFTRALSEGDKGSDVFIMQMLLNRSSSLCVDGDFGPSTRMALEGFQRLCAVPATGVLDAISASDLLSKHLRDGYRDRGGPLPSWAKFKIHVPVLRNRSVETIASLIAPNGSVLFRTQVLAHGQNGPDGVALNELTSDGSTPTGLSTCDLNSPEPDPVSYGPYPVVRLVKGLEGNAVVESDIRNGILLHSFEKNVTRIPYSHGCIHEWLPEQKELVRILTEDLGVVVNKNPFSGRNYPYPVQGLFSVELFD